jgi:cytoskeleton protein RodZ
MGSQILKAGPNEAMFAAITLDGAMLDGQGINAPRVGADLRAARERLGHSLPEMAGVLRIRLPYLQALESGRIGDLPGSAYALGFLRTYANFLGLDPGEISRRFKIEADEINHKIELEFPAPIPGRGMPAGAVVLLGAVLALGAYIGWYRLSAEGRLPAETVALMPERLASLVAPPVAPTIAAPPAVEAPLAEARLPAPVVLPPSGSVSGEDAAALPLPPPVPATLVSALSASAALPLPPPLSVAPSSAAPAPVPATALAPAVSPPAASPISADGRVVIRATADAWIQLRERSGTVIFTGILKPGETFPVPNRPDVLLTTGNAIATELFVDGAATPGLGAAKGVRRDLVLIKSGRLAAQADSAQQIVARPQ